jgi:hypothetical protein
LTAQREIVLQVLGAMPIREQKDDEVLLDHFLRLTEAGNDGSQLRSYIYYCMALLEYQEQGGICGRRLLQIWVMTVSIISYLRPATGIYYKPYPRAIVLASS